VLQCSRIFCFFDSLVGLELSQVVWRVLRDKRQFFWTVGHSYATLVLAAAMLRTAWEDFNETIRISYAGAKATSLIPETTSTTQDSFVLKKNKRSALAVKRGKERARAKAGSVPGNQNKDHSSSAARAVRSADESRGGVIQEGHPKSVNEGDPHLSKE